ncbi:MAG: aminoacyl-tRNA hydrolase [Eubacteriales bacterium]
MVKQVIVMRKDLNMRKGKMVAQGAHASLGDILGMMSVKEMENSRIMTLEVEKGSFFDRWINGGFTKICVSVNSESELIDIYDRAKKLNIPCVLIRDAGLTEFNGVPTFTCCAVGPDDEENVDKITGELSLL